MAAGCRRPARGAFGRAADLKRRRARRRRRGEADLAAALDYGPAGGGRLAQLHRVEAMAHRRPELQAEPAAAVLSGTEMVQRRLAGRNMDGACSDQWRIMRPCTL